MTVRTSIGIATAAIVLSASPLAAQTANPSWEGFYIGINAGGLWSTTSATIGMNNTFGGYSGSGGGFVGGIQGGYNYLLGPVLLGAEIDFQGSTLSSGLNGGAGPSVVNLTSRMPWFSTMRARAGYPIGSVMPYVTGGAVWGNQRLSGFDSRNGWFDSSNNFWTYTFGGGVEGRLNDRWSAKLEYLWIGTPDTQLAPPAANSVSERSIGNLLRVGVNYRF